MRLLFFINLKFSKSMYTHIIPYSSIERKNMEILFQFFLADLEEKQRVREDDAIRVREYDDEWDMISDIIIFIIFYKKQSRVTPVY